VLGPGTHRIGKEDDNDLVVHDGAVSRLHLTASVLPSSVRFADQKSTNGSFCDGMRFTSLEVGANSTIRIGNTVLRVVPTDVQKPSLPPSKSDRFGELWGQSLVMRHLFALLEKVAPSDVSVLLLGETGTGKDLCARAIHQHSARAAAPFVVCDLAAVSPELIEAELLGHVKGAYTGASADRAGPFERANHGTLFLDEVGELPLELQPRLLRVLESRQVQRVGGTTSAKVDVRVIAATQRDLGQMMREGKFREDLYFRLAVTTVTLPPLRDRWEDIPLLMQQIAEKSGKPMVEFAPETRALLCDYRWPGNVRELRNVVEHALSIDSVPQVPSESNDSLTPVAARGAGFHEAKERLVVAFERDFVGSLMKKCDNNVALAARTAGIDRAYLHRLLKKHRKAGATD
jgi:DNA-binding NtrC family response regulator